MNNTQDAAIALVLEKLKALHPYKIILFGSHAYGNPGDASDIDLLVVLDSDEMPGSFQENMANKLLVRNALGALSEAIPIDLIVHTRPMHRKFNALDSLFAREIRQRGKVLYEADHP